MPALPCPNLLFLLHFVDLRDLPVEQVLPLHVQLLVCTKVKGSTPREKAYLHLGPQLVLAQLRIDFVQDLYTAVEILLRQHVFECHLGGFIEIDFQFGEKTLKESQRVGKCSSNLVLAFLFEIKEAGPIKELAPISPECPPLFRTIEIALDMIFGALGEVGDQGLTVLVLQIHECSQFLVADSSCPAEEEVQQSQHGYLPAISVLHEYLSVEEFDAAINHWFGYFQGCLLLLLFTLHAVTQYSLYPARVISQQPQHQQQLLFIQASFLSVSCNLPDRNLRQTVLKLMSYLLLV